MFCGGRARYFGYHIGPAVGFGSRVNDLGPGAPIMFVGKTGTGASLALYIEHVPGLNQSQNPGRC